MAEETLHFWQCPYTLDPEDEDERGEHVDGDEDRNEDLDELEHLGMKHATLSVGPHVAEEVVGGLLPARRRILVRRDFEQGVVERGGRLLRVGDGRYRPDEDHGRHQLQRWRGRHFNLLLAKQISYGLCCGIACLRS